MPRRNKRVAPPLRATLSRRAGGDYSVGNSKITFEIPFGRAKMAKVKKSNHFEPVSIFFSRSNSASLIHTHTGAARIANMSNYFYQFCTNCTLPIPCIHFSFLFTPLPPISGALKNTRLGNRFCRRRRTVLEELSDLAFSAVSPQILNFQSYGTAMCQLTISRMGCTADVL